MCLRLPTSSLSLSHSHPEFAFPRLPSIQAKESGDVDSSGRREARIAMAKYHLILLLSERREIIKDSCSSGEQKEREESCFDPMERATQMREADCKGVREGVQCSDCSRREAAGLVWCRESSAPLSLRTPPFDHVIRCFSYFLFEGGKAA